MVGPSGSIYAGETFNIRCHFPPDYPSVPPKIFFLKPVPKHVHVYSNGDICLDILGKEWRPNLSVESVLVSILSMLVSARGKSVPHDNLARQNVEPGNQQDGWMYHDDRC